MWDLLYVMHQDGFLTSEEMTAVRSMSKKIGENPVKVLRALNIADPETIQSYQKKFFKALVFDSKMIDSLDESYQSYIPLDLAINFSCFGLGTEGKDLYIAVEDPLDKSIKTELGFFLNRRIIGISATVYDLHQGICKIYNVPASILKLTSQLEKSRGIVGGVRYREQFIKSVKIDENFEGVGLSNEENQSIYDDSDNNDQLKSDEPELGINENLSAQEDLMSKVQKLSDDDTSVHEKQDFKSNQVVDPDDLERISNASSQAMVKLAMLSEKVKAVDVLNSILEPLSVNVKLINEKQFQISGKDFSIKGPVETRSADEHHPLYDSLEPLMKKIIKMK